MTLPLRSELDTLNHDSLLKSLHRNLADLIDPRQLRACGWQDFAAFDHTSKDVPTLAAEALLHLGTDGGGSWCSNANLVIAMLAFTNEHGGRNPTPDELRGLAAFLKPVSPADITEWFRCLFA